MRAPVDCRSRLYFGQGKWYQIAKRWGATQVHITRSRRLLHQDHICKDRNLFPAMVNNVQTMTAPLTKTKLRARARTAVVLLM